MIGIPYELGGRGRALDCVGVVLHWFARRGRPLVDPWAKVSQAYRRDEFCGDRYLEAGWERVPHGFERVDDVVLLNAERRADHCGVIVAHDVVLHTTEKTGSLTSRLSALRRAGKVHSVWRP